MQFYARKRRQPPAIIIVALIDILIVLLIFLVVTTTFKQQPALNLALPESSQAQKTGANEEAPLLVTIDPRGSLRLGTEGKPVTAERLKEEAVVSPAHALSALGGFALRDTHRINASIKISVCLARPRQANPPRAGRCWCFGPGQ